MCFHLDVDLQLNWFAVLLSDQHQVILDQHHHQHLEWFTILISKPFFTGACWGYLECSIRGTNNQLPNMFYKFVYLQLFNNKNKIVHLQVVWSQIFVSWKSYLLQTEENCCLWTYGWASLVSDFKFTQENDDLSSSRHK